MNYNAYFTVRDPETKKVLGRRELEQFADSINAHVEEIRNLRWAPDALPRVRFATRLGVRVLRVEAYSAEQARINVRETMRFLRLTGYSFENEMTRATQKALTRVYVS